MALNSSSEHFRVSAAQAASSLTYAGSQRFPRYGTGARYGQSVSSMNFPGGAAARHSRILPPFLKVKIPVKLTREPISTTRRILPASSEKQ